MSMAREMSHAMRAFHGREPHSMVKAWSIIATAVFSLVTLSAADAATSAPSSVPASSIKFTMCKSTYALCTTAACVPIAGQKGNLNCPCSVHTGYSGGVKACQAVQHTAAGDLVYSRYYPVKAYAECSNDRPWAWCLDVPCLIDKKDPSKANCTCTVTKNQNPYVIVTDHYTAKTCSTGIISSATVSGITQISNFIQAQKLIPPFTIKVLNTPPPSK
jgi:hypothetical protein